MSDHLIVSVHVLDGCPVIMLRGELDMTTAGALAEALAGQARDRAARVVVDLSALDYLASAGVQVLLKAQQDLMAAGGSFAVTCPRPIVARVLQLTGTDQLIPVYNNLREAADGHVDCW